MATRKDEAAADPSRHIRKIAMAPRARKTQAAPLVPRPGKLIAVRRKAALIAGKASTINIGAEAIVPYRSWAQRTIRIAAKTTRPIKAIFTAAAAYCVLAGCPTKK